MARRDGQSLNVQVRSGQKEKGERQREGGVRREKEGGGTERDREKW